MSETDRPFDADQDETAAPTRRKTHRVLVGSVAVGGDEPIVVQAMTDADTADVEATGEQIAQLAEAGAQAVRIAVDRPEAAAAVPHIRDALRRKDIRVPIVGDFHYIGDRLLADHPACAEALDKYRINPGNVGFGDRRDRRFAAIVEIALRCEKPIRIGGNWGSLDQRLLTEMMDRNAKAERPQSSRSILRQTLIASVLQSADFARSVGMPADRIVLSAKVSEAVDLIAVYRSLAARCAYPLHLGLTEAGMGARGVVASSAALAILLHEGIGDTIRISLTPAPGGDRCEEVRIAQLLLQSLDLRRFAPSVAACPGCGRTSSGAFRDLAARIEDYARARMPQWRRDHVGVEAMKLAVMGCIVNGPGESKYADIGISLPGNGEAPVAPVFVDGRKAATLRGDDIAEKFQTMIEDYVAHRYPRRPAEANAESSSAPSSSPSSSP